MNLDATDRNLLNLLQRDATLTTKALALKLDMSSTAVYERIRKLRREGVIAGEVALLDREKIGKPFVVFCHIKLQRHSREEVIRFEREVAKLDEVHECFHVSGDSDYILKVLVENMQVYREFMVGKLTALQIGSTQSSFMISEVKNTTAFAL
jgi:Lrp/AsnC family leucine-responsive transcriptional regulator